MVGWLVPFVLNCECVQTLAQRGRGASVLGDAQNLIGHGPAIVDSALSRCLPTSAIL